MVEQLPAIEQKVAFLTSHGPEPATYTGALLWPVLEQAQMLGGDPISTTRSRGDL
jgi:hypothetical protein